MEQALYDHPAVYDALYAEKPYGAEVAFVLDRAPTARSALIVGCGTGEHARPDSTSSASIRALRWYVERGRSPTRRSASARCRSYR